MGTASALAPATPATAAARRTLVVAALGTITGDAVYQVRMREDFHPWRLDVRFDDSIRAADARPLVERLSFVPDPRRWGYPFRRGLSEVTADDFAVIEAAMRAGPPG